MLKNIRNMVLIIINVVLVSGCMSVPNDDTLSDTSVIGNNSSVSTGIIHTGKVSQAGYYLGNNYSVNAPANQKYYFDFAITDVHKEYIASIKAQAQYLRSHHRARIRLEGNTDVRGSREYNVGLGERRALAIAQLLQVYGALKSQMVVVSYGEERPVALGHSEDAYRLNRRVDLVYEVK